MKLTIENLKQEGWKGIQRNNWTGNELEANYVLDNILWTLKNKPERLQYKNDDVRGKVYVTIKNENWTPAQNHELYAVRNMTAGELLEADKRLAKLGITVNR